MTDSPSCTMDAYKGTKNTTWSGLPCKKWKKYDHNYCRNPNQRLGPWCWTVPKEIVWQYCFLYKSKVKINYFHYAQ